MTNAIWLFDPESERSDIKHDGNCKMLPIHTSCNAVDQAKMSF